MANEITFGYRSGATLTYGAYQPDGSVRTAVGTSLPENGSTGYYIATDGSIQAGDIVIVKEGTDVVGWGEYQPGTTVINPDDCKADVGGLPTVEEIITALKASDGWLTDTGSGTLSFKQIITILTAWAGGKVTDAGGGVYNILDPEDDSTIIFTVIPSESSPYKDTNIG